MGYRLMTTPIAFDSRPAPEPDFISKPFFDSLEQGVLCVQKCSRCEAVQLGELICNQCFAQDLQWVPASGQGKVHSCAIVHLAYHPAFAVPYAVVSVELAEGPRLLANMADCDLQDIQVGMPVVMRPSKLATGVTVPLFVPA